MDSLSKVAIGIFLLAAVLLAGASLASAPAQPAPSKWVTPTVGEVWHWTCAHYDLVDTSTGEQVASNQQSCRRWKE